MPALLELLDQYFFADVPGLYARNALTASWQLAANTPWEQLYSQALNDALAEEIPHLAAFSGDSTIIPSHDDLARVLTTELGEAGNALYAHDLSSGTFLTELARAMQAARLLQVNQQNLYTDEYRQILLNLFDYAHARFKSVITEQPEQFIDALEQTTRHDTLLRASIVAYLTRQFGIHLSLPSAPLPSPESAASAQELPRAAETLNANPADAESPRAGQNRLRVLLATPPDVMNERAVLTALIQEVDARARARFGLQLELIQPTPADFAGVNSAVELADIFIGVVWLQFSATSNSINPASGEAFFAGAETDFSLALEQGGGRSAGWLRTVIYRSIHPPLDLLHLNLNEYTRVEDFFERAADYGGEDLVRVYTHVSELDADAQARLDAWIYNYAGDLANALTEYGKRAANFQEYQDALSDYDQAANLYRELERPAQELALRLELAALYRQTNQRARAAQALDTARHLARETQDDHAAANALHQAGLLAADANEWENALYEFQNARAYLKPDAAQYREIITDEIFAQENLGDLAQRAAEAERAREHYRAALPLAQEIDDSARASALWQKLGALAVTRADWGEAVETYQHAASNLDASAAPSTRTALYDALAHVQTQLAIQARDAGDTSAAEQSYRAALDANAQGSHDRARRIGILTALGALAAGQQHWENAIEANARALNDLDAAQDASLRGILLAEQAAAYKNLGAVRLAASDFESADGAYRVSFALYGELEARGEQGIILNQLGVLAAAQGHWQNANTAFARAVPYLDAPEMESARSAALHGQASALEHIGNAHQDAQEWAQAEISYLQARAHLEQLHMNDETASILVKLGLVTAAQGRRQEALAYFQQARLGLNEPDQSDARERVMRYEVNTLHQIGELERGAGDFSQAEAVCRQQLDLAQTLQDSTLESDALYQLGLLASDREQWDDAVEYYDRALTLTVDPAQTDARALTLRKQLHAYQKIGEREGAAHALPQAEIAYRSALTYAQELQDRDSEADLLFALGLVAIQRENWDEALTDLRRALDIYNLRPAAPNKPQVIWNIGRAQRGAKRRRMQETLAQAAILHQQQDWSGATAASQNALELARELGDAQTETLALKRLGDTASDLGQWDNALAYYASARALTDKLHAPELRAELVRAQIVAARARGDAYRIHGDLESAEQQYSHALAAALSQNDRVNAGELYFVLGTLAADNRAWEKALGNYTLALDYVDSNYHDDIKTYQALAFQNWGDALRATGQFDNALNAYTFALQRANETQDAERAANVFYRFGLLNAALGEWRDALAYYHQADARAPQDDTALRESITLERTRAEQALKRAQLDTQLAHAETARYELQWDDAATAYRAAYGLALELDDATARESAARALVAVYASKATTLQKLELEAEANDAYRESIQLADEFQLSDESAARRADLLALYIARTETCSAAGEYADAENAAQQTLALAREFQNENAQADSLYMLGSLAAGQGEWGRAKTFYEQARPLLVTAERSDALLQLDDDLARANDGLERERLQQETFALAQTAEQSGDLAGAEAAYRQSLELARGLGKPALAASLTAALVRLSSQAADTWRAEQNWERAEPAYRHALAVAYEFDDAEAVQARQRDLVTLAAARTASLQGQGNAADLERAAQELFAVAQEFDRAEAQADALYTLATLAAEQGEWEKAKVYYEQARPFFAAQGHSAKLEELDAGLARADDILQREQLLEETLILAPRAEQARDFERADAAYRQALDLARGLGKSNDAAALSAALVKLSGQRARAWRAAQDWAGAEPAYRQALAVAQEFEDAEQIYTRQQALIVLAVERAGIARAQQDWVAAESAYRDALAVAYEFKDNDAAQTQQNNLLALAAARAYALRGAQDWQGAEFAFRDALAVAHEFGDVEAVQARQNDLTALSAARTEAFQSADDWANTEMAAVAQIQVAQEFQDSKAQARGYAALGAILAAQHKWQAALDSNTRASELLTEPEEAAQVAEIGAANTAIMRAYKTELCNQARVRATAAETSQDWQTAEQENQRALALAQELEDASSASEIQTDLARLNAAQNRWRHAAQLYTAALAPLEQPGQSARRSELVNLRMSARGAAGDAAVSIQAWDDALEQYAYALSDAQELGAPSDAVSFLCRMANAASQHNDLYGALGYYDNALASLDESTEKRRGEILTRQADVWQVLGDGEMNEHQFARAARAYEHALEINTALDRTNERAWTLHSLGLALGARGQWAQALQALQDAYALVRDLDAPQLQSELLTSVADAEQQLHQLEAARANYLQALALTPADNVQQHAQIESALGEIGLAQKHWQEAITHFTVASQAFQELGDAASARTLQDKSATSYAGLGDLKFGEGDWQGADLAYQNAVALDRATGRADRDASLYYRLARTDAAQTQYAEAIEHYESALAAVDVQELVLRDRILAQLAFTLQQQGKRALADADWRDAELILERALKMAVASDNFDQAADISLALGHALAAQENQARAQAAFRSALAFDVRDGSALRETEIQQALANSMLTSARTEMERGTTENARETLQQALCSAERAQNPLLQGEILQALGDATASHAPEQAIEFYAQAGRRFAFLEAMALWRQVSARQATLLTQIAETQREQQLYADAANNYRRALLLQQATGTTQKLDQNYLGLGGALAAQARWDEAADAFENAQARWDEAADAFENAQAHPIRDDDALHHELFAQYAATLEQIGAHAKQESRWQAAQNAFARAAAFRDAVGAHTQAGADWHRLAQIAAAQELWTDAAQANQEALARLDEPDGSATRRAVLNQQAQVLGHIGQKQQAAGDLAQASETYRGALVIVQEEGDLPDLAQLYTQLGALAEAQSEWDTARSEYHHALDVYQALEQPGEQAAVWARLGAMHRAAGQYGDAFDAYTSARALYHTIKQVQREGEMLHQLGLTRGDVQDWDGALTWFERALSLYNQHDERAAKIEIYDSIETAVRHAKRAAADE